MSPNLRIAFRFLTAKKRAMLMSLSCIVLGVGLFVITQATTSGFEKFFIKTILGTNGAMRVQDKIQDTMRSMAAGGENSKFRISSREGRKYIEGIEEPQLVVNALMKFANVSGASIVLNSPAILRNDSKTDSIKIFGINLDDHLRVSDLASQIVDGKLEDFRNSPSGILIGRELCNRQGLAIGDSIIIDARGQQRRYRISAIYETGVSDIDRAYVYLNMGEARSLLKKPTGATYIQVNLIDKDRAPEDAVHIEEVLQHQARSWQWREKPWLSAFKALSISSAITTSVFTLIAGLAMLNTLAMIVIEKTKDIAILRSMGYERKDITQIFLWQALIVLAIGTSVGAALGYAGTYAVSRIPMPVTGIFRTETFQVYISPWHYVAAVLMAAVMVMGASIIPARRAARMEPGDIVRGTST
ncbi:MAG: ABC transporter permease [Verrucomicrobia bacterium]|nr:ABC transporter permease [Verrucomicrobiota bacterium]